MNTTHPIPEMGTEKDVAKRRIGAWIIDIVIWVAVFFLFILVLMATTSPPTLAWYTAPPGELPPQWIFAGTSGMVISSFIAVLVWLILIAGPEAIWGQTFSKMLLGIVTVKEDGAPCTPGVAFGRNLIRMLESLGVIFVVPLISIYLTDRKQCLADKAFGTVVTRSQSPPRKSH